MTHLHCQPVPSRHHLCLDSTGGLLVSYLLRAVCSTFGDYFQLWINTHLLSHSCGINWGIVHGKDKNPSRVKTNAIKYYRSDSGSVLWWSRTLIPLINRFFSELMSLSRNVVLFRTEWIIDMDCEGSTADSETAEQADRLAPLGEKVGNRNMSPHF